MSVFDEYIRCRRAIKAFKPFRDRARVHGVDGAPLYRTFDQIVKRYQRRAIELRAKLQFLRLIERPGN